MKKTMSIEKAETTIKMQKLVEQIPLTYSSARDPLDVTFIPKKKSVLCHTGTDNLHLSRRWLKKEWMSSNHSIVTKIERPSILTFLVRKDGWNKARIRCVVSILRAWLQHGLPSRPPVRHRVKRRDAHMLAKIEGKVSRVVCTISWVKRLWTRDASVGIN